MLKERTERLLEKSGRISPRRVLEAYESTGLRPGITSFRPDEFTACGMGVLMAVEDINPVRDYDEMIWFLRDVELSAGLQYPVGFYEGFDGGAVTAMTTFVKTHPTATKGYRDGKRVRKFVEARFGEEAFFTWR